MTTVSGVTMTWFTEFDETVPRRRDTVCTSSHDGDCAGAGARTWGVLRVPDSDVASDVGHAAVGPNVGK